MNKSQEKGRNSQDIKITSAKTHWFFRVGRTVDSLCIFLIMPLQNLSLHLFLNINFENMNVMAQTLA